MPDNFPHTEPAWQNTRAANAETGDFFAPDVRVQLRWSDIEEAVERGAIVPSEAHALWAMWAAPGSPRRVSSRKVPAAEADQKDKARSRTSFFHSLF